MQPHEENEGWREIKEDAHGRVTYDTMRDIAPDPMAPAQCFIEWPHGSPFAAWSSHDVDNFYNARKRVKETIANATKLRIPQAVKTLAGSDPSTLAKIADIDESLGIPSTFFLLSVPTFNGGGYTVPLTDLAIVQPHFEIALHASYEAHMNTAKLAQEKALLEDRMKQATGTNYAVRGVRHHYLRFKLPYTWRAQSGIFDYDSSFGWPDQIGYRGGRAEPFEAEAGLWEIPIACMDVTLLYHQREGWDYAKRLIDAVAEAGGLFTYLWHNESLVPYSGRRPGYYEMYAKITQYLQAKGAWFATGAAILDVAKAQTTRS